MITKYIRNTFNGVGHLYTHWEDWRQLLSPVFQVVLVCILLVLLSIGFRFQVPASGSILVVAALAGDLLLPYTILHRCYPNYSVEESNTVEIAKKLRMVEGQCGKYFRYLQGSDVNWAELSLGGMPDIRMVLFRLASRKPNPYLEVARHFDHSKKQEFFVWEIEVTHTRINKHVRVFLLALAILGTLMWGYGQFIGETVSKWF